MIATARFAKALPRGTREAFAWAGFAAQHLGTSEDTWARREITRAWALLAWEALHAAAEADAWRARCDALVARSPYVARVGYDVVVEVAECPHPWWEECHGDTFEYVVHAPWRGGAACGFPTAHAALSAGIAHAVSPG